MIENETADEAGLSGHFVLHVHDLNHVQIDLLITSDGLHSIDDDLSKRVGNRGVHLRVKRGFGNSEEGVAGHLRLGDLELLKEAEGLKLSLLDTINDDPGVDTLAEVALCLAHELTDEEHVSGGAITDDIILSSGSAANHSSGRMLDLHLVEQDTAVLGQLDLTGTADEPKEEKTNW